jgi:dCTP deaminase
MTRKAVAVMALHRGDGDLYLVRTRFLEDFWQPVGGSAKSTDENLLSAAIREVQEEVGIQLTPGDVKFELKVPWDLGVGDVYCFSAMVAGEISIASEELVEGRWFSIDDAIQLPSLPATSAFTRHLLAARESTDPVPRSATSLQSENLVAPSTDVIGTLTDRQLLPMFRRGDIIASGFVEDNLRGSSYELRASDTYYDLSVGKVRMKLDAGQNLLLKPQHLYVLITEEVLGIPTDMMCRMVSKGSTFSVGLLPVSTWVDPGFSGRLGVVYYNASHHYLQLERGHSIAKLEFIRLANAVDHPYSGQHGFGTGIWPISEDVIMSDAEIKQDPRIAGVLDEAIAALSPPIAAAVRRVFRFERYLIGTMLAYILLALVLLALSPGGKALGWLPAIGLGIVANILTAAVVLIATHFSRKQS